MNIEQFVFFKPIKQIEYKRWLIPLGVLLVVVLLSAYRESLGPYDYTSDQINYGVMILNVLKPENLANDYIWQDPTYSTFYTPSFRYLMTAMTRLAGGYGQALNMLMIPAALIFMVGMMSLSYQVTGRRWLSTAIAVLASLFHSFAPVGGIWGPMLSVSGMTPRNFFLPLVPFLFGWLFHNLSTGSSRWVQWLALGFAFGLASNIHPVSGYVTAGVLGGMVLLAAIRGDIQWRDLLWTAVGGIVGSLPILISFLSRPQAVSVSEYSFTFEEFLATARASGFARVWPWAWPVQLRLVTHWFLPSSLSEAPELAMFGTHAALTVLAAGGLWLTRSNPDSVWRRVSFVVLVATQTLMLVLFVSDSGVISFFVTLYAVHIFLHKRSPDWLDRRMYEILAILVLLTSLSIIIQLIWIRYEVWGLTAWGRMLPRGLRFIYLPAYLMIGRLLLDWQQEIGWPAALAGLTMILFPVSLQPLERVLALLLAALVVSWIIWPKRGRRPTYVHFAMPGTSTAFIVERVADLLDVQYSHLPAVAAFLLVIGLAWLGQTRHKSRQVMQYSLIAGTLLIIMLVPQRYHEGASRQMLPMALQVSGDTLVKNIPWFKIPTISHNELALREMAIWARDNTPIQSVFYLRDDMDDLTNRFRFFAERSVTHSAKDRSIAYMLQYPFVEVIRRTEELQTGFESEEALTRLAAMYHADYVALKSSSDLSPDWPIVYQNDRYTLYQLP